MEAKHSLGQPRLLISRSALLHNARFVRKLVGERVRICGTVKADAYGHGSDVVADALANFSDDSGKPAVDGFAVATIEEAAELPPSPLPVAVLRPVENVYLGRQRSAIELAIQSGWTLTICSLPAVDDVARIAGSIGKRAHVQVMVDTGMTRSGIQPSDVDEILRRIETRPSLRLVAICSHFASSEIAEHPFTQQQLDWFKDATDDYAEFHQGKMLRHIANSGGVFFTPASHLDMVRPGISLLGIDPTGKPSTDRPLRPALKWTAPLVAIHDVQRGRTVGYNQTWIAPRDTRIGVVPVGYADGYSREFGDRAVMTLGGKQLPVVGRVSMDFTTIDLAAAPSAVVGDEVTVLDNNPIAPNSVYRLAEIAGTIPYEIFCRIGQRVARVGVDPEDATQADARPTGLRIASS
jgi:alanine racemase